MIYVSNLRDMPTHASRLKPSLLVSLLGVEGVPTTPAGVAPKAHLFVEVDDISQPMPGYVAPAHAHVETLVGFLDGWDRRRPALIHCYAGVSRSTAAALILLSLNNPGREHAAARTLRDRAPHAQPNRRIIGLADQIMGLDGRLIGAVEAMGDADFATMGSLVELPAVLDPSA